MWQARSMAKLQNPEYPLVVFFKNGVIVSHLAKPKSIDEILEASKSHQSDANSIEILNMKQGYQSHRALPSVVEVSGDTLTQSMLQLQIKSLNMQIIKDKD